MKQFRYIIFPVVLCMSAACGQQKQYRFRFENSAKCQSVTYVIEGISGPMDTISIGTIGEQRVQQSVYREFHLPDEELIVRQLNANPQTFRIHAARAKDHQVIFLGADDEGSQELHVDTVLVDKDYVSI